MAMTNMYPNLPGHLVEFKDGGLQLTTLPNSNTGFKKSLLILGTAIDGPINEPVKIDEKTVTQLFGSEVNKNNYPNGATLTKYAKQAFAHGFTDVRCMRITGTQASYTTTVSTESETKQISRTTDPVYAEGHPAVENIQLDYFPISIDRGFDSFYLCTTKPSEGNPHPNHIGNAGISYSCGSGKVSIFKDQLNKNATVFAVYNHQKIYGKDTNNDGAPDIADGKQTVDRCPFITTAIVNGIDVEAIRASDFNDGDNIVFKLKVDKSKGEKLYSQPFMVNNPIDADGYPKMYSAIVEAEKNNDNTITTPAKVDESNAKSMSQDLKVIITGTYSPSKSGVSPQKRVLSKNEFTIDDDGTITIPYDNTKVNVTYTDGTNENDIPYTEYAVQYLVYTNEYAEQQITLSGAPDDEITLDDIGIVDNSIEVTVNGITLKKDQYDVTKNATNTVVAVHAGSAGIGAQIVVKYDIEETIAVNKNVTFKSIYGGTRYNNSYIKLEKYPKESSDKKYIKISFIKPDFKKYFTSEPTLYYKSSDILNIGQLRDFLKNDELNNVFTIETNDDSITLEELFDGVRTQQGLEENSDSVQFSLIGGEDGISPTNEELFKALSGERDENGYLIRRGAYQILENYHCDYIYPAGVYADKTVEINGRQQNFQYELALACAVLTYRTKMTHGFIDVSPNSNTSLVGIQNYVDKLLAMPNLFYMKNLEGNDILDSENKRMDIGWYTSVVVGPEPVMISDTLGTYYGSPAIAYSALVASLKPQSSPMNKALPKVKGVKYKFSNKQMDALIGNRMVCFRLKNEGSATATSVPYCVDAMTSGAPKCDYARMTTVSVVTDVIDQIREVADPYIGEPNTVEQRNALSAQIAKRLSYIYENGEITYYSFEINATIEQVLLGECTISLTLVCPMELRKITTVVSLRAAA